MKTTAILFTGLTLLLTSCGKDEPVSYLAPKDAAPAATPASTPSKMMGSTSQNDAVIAAHAAMEAQAPAGAGFKVDLPKGWKEVPGSGMRKVSYTIEGTSIDFYLIALSMGDVPSNVNRWRGQVALDAATPQEIAKQVENFQVSGHGVNYIEIYNADAGKGIIAAIVDLAPQYWYFTAKGSVDELQAHASEIRGFLESIKIN